MARGIDGEAHRGALDAGGVTVAVLGGGIDRDCPAAHAELARRIADTGLAVSEYAPGVEPAPWRFPARNRVIAGLSAGTVGVEARGGGGARIRGGLGAAPWTCPARNRVIAGLSAVTVVVEARERSGALITADLALEEGREVFAVPGEITSALSAGTNELLRLGAAPLLGSADVLELVGLAARPTPAARPLPRPADGVLARRRAGPTSADELVRSTGLDAGALSSALTELVLAG